MEADRTFFRQARRRSLFSPANKSDELPIRMTESSRVTASYKPINNNLKVFNIFYPTDMLIHWSWYKFNTRALSPTFCQYYSSHKLYKMFRKHEFRRLIIFLRYFFMGDFSRNHPPKWICETHETKEYITTFYTNGEIKLVAVRKSCRPTSVWNFRDT